MRSALIVVDVQQSFTHRPYFSAEHVPAYLAAQNRLIEGFAARGLPIVRVFHVSPGGDAADPADPFAAASGLVKPLEGLRDFDAALEVRKTRHSALVGTGLDVWLTEQGIGEIVVSGIRTEQCCETTTRHASDLGWKVVFVPEATLTFDMTLPDGSPFRAEDIVARTSSVLTGRFAQVLDVSQTLAHVGNR